MRTSLHTMVLSVFGLLALTSTAQPLKQPPARKHAMPVFFERHGSAFVAQGFGYGLQLAGGEATVSTNAGTEVVSIRPLQANPAAAAIPEGMLPGKSNYYVGNDPAAWMIGVPQFRAVRYGSIYEGIDLVYYGSDGKLEFDFVVSAGADPGRINLGFRGVRVPRVDGAGDLVLHTSSGELRQHRAIAYQMAPGRRVPVPVEYSVNGDGVVSFILGAYDRDLPLIIDPILTYASYVGGNGVDDVNGIAFDSAGNIYVAGNVGSTTFPAGSPLSSYLQGPDAYVMKLSPDGKQVLYRTVFGGTGNDTAFVYIALQADGSAVVVGATDASNFPRMNPLQNFYGGGDSDAFVSRFNPGGQMTFSTYLGGSFEDGPSDVAVDSNGNLYVAGWTSSPDFPRSNAQQNQYGGGPEDGFITKYSPTGSAMLYSTYFGGSGDDFFNAFAVDATGNMYGSGYTESTNLPVTQGAFQTSNGGGSDAFAIKLNASGSSLVFATYLGGSADDWAIGLDVDSQGNVYVGGNTLSNNFPVRSIQSTRGGLEDAFLTKLNSSGSQLIHSTYIGGSGRDLVEWIRVNRYNEAYVTGWTESNNFPVKNATQPQKGAGVLADAFLFKVNAQGDALVYSTYIGGPADDIPLALAIDRVGGLVGVGGYTDGGGFPTMNPAQSAPGGNDDGWLVLSEEAVAAQGASYVREQLAPNSIASVFGANFSTEFQATASAQLPTTILGVTVTITDNTGFDRLCGLFFVAPGQINYAVPAGTPLGPAVLTVRTADGRLLRGTITIVSVAPGVFSLNASGQGVAAANLLRVRNGVAGFESLARHDGTQWVPEPIDMGPASDQIYLIMYGTGLRNAGSATATVGGETVAVAGPVDQGQFVGLDQMNLGPLPRTLAGRGVVNIVTQAGGKTANTVTVSIR